jgi:hypothetical protein
MSKVPVIASFGAIGRSMRMLHWRMPISVMNHEKFPAMMNVSLLCVDKFYWHKYVRRLSRA